MTIADEIAADIASGKLEVGDCLPAQREFAYRRNIAPSTASRVYEELGRRGLVSGEVGRGTFVRTAVRPGNAALIEPVSAPVDLELNFPVLPGQRAAMSKALGELASTGGFDAALRPVGAGADSDARDIAARFLSRNTWSAAARNILFTGSGRQAIAASLAALAKPGDRIAVEPLTYAALMGIAAQLGLALVPLGMDDRGATPASLLRASKEQSLSAVYLQPSMHNPLGVTMDEQRRMEIADVLTDTNLVAVEDGIYSFLADELPLCAYAPDRVIFIHSLSKCLAPGFVLGVMVVPDSLLGSVASSIRFGGWTVSGLPLAAGLQWMASPGLQKIIAAKRADAEARQLIAREIFREPVIAGDHRSYHFWLPLPEPWRGETFVAAALRLGIALAPGSAFAASYGHAPAGVRIALASPEQSVLIESLRIIHRLAAGELQPASVD